MLHYNTINAKTLELLKAIQRVDIFKNLRLVGGTALALQIGHRVSVDLDFFGNLEADNISVMQALNKIGDVKTIQNTENIHIYTINGIKVAIVNYPYPWLAPIVNQDGLCLAAVTDIAAMKLAAITGRGSKKDFIDIYVLLKQFSLYQLIEFYKQKYHDGSVFLVLRSLAYFDDADDELMPKLFKTLSWEAVKTSISEALKTYINNNADANLD